MESCNAVNVVTVGLHIKKSTFDGEMLNEFGESLGNILSITESQLLTLLIVHHCELLHKAEKGAYATLRRERSRLTREKMEHVRERLMMIQ